jgi:hypothetical protein
MFVTLQHFKRVWKGRIITIVLTKGGKKESRSRSPKRRAGNARMQIARSLREKNNLADMQWLSLPSE